MSTSIAEAFGFTRERFATPSERRAIATLEQGLADVEDRLTEHLRFADPVVDAVARYLKDAGGKRVRPMLLLLSAQLGDGVTDDVLQAAEVVELTHLASLYHDDVMDEAPVRRGVPSAHEVWSNSVAILAGDLLFARAAKLTAPLGAEVAELQAHTFERLCLGQMNETLGVADGVDAGEHYLRVLADKTGSLIAAAAELGVVVGNADAAYRAPLREFGEQIGVAFQLVDDVIDLSDDPATGKMAGTDVRAGVPTLPMLRLSVATDAKSQALLARLRSSEDAEFAEAVQELSEHEVTRSTLAEARRWQARALEALEALPRGTVRRGLEQFARTVVSREY